MAVLIEKDSKYLWAAIGLAACSLFFFTDHWHVQKSHEGDDSIVSRIEVIPVPGGAIGPESLVFGPDGEGPYTGVSDGRILKWRGEELGWLEYAVVTSQHLLKECRSSQNLKKKEDLCGRPLGIQFNKMNQDLYIADAHLGLLRVGLGEKFATRVITHVQGLPLYFTNGLDIAQDSGIIYFTDSSMRFRRREFMSAVISGDRSGRVVRYDPQHKEAQVLISGLYYPNGLALSQDGSFLLIAETTTCRLLKYWLQPAEKGVEVLIQLPGFPDNIKPSPRGGFWVALYSRRGRFMQWLLSFPHWLRELFLWLPLDLNRILPLFSGRYGKALALRISEEGEVLQVLEDFGGNIVKHVSEIEEQNGTLWIGSVVMPHLGLYKL